MSFEGSGENSGLDFAELGFRVPAILETVVPAMSSFRDESTSQQAKIMFRDTPRVHSEAMQDHYNYLDATRELEVETEKAQYLTGMARRLATGLSHVDLSRLRVVVMDRGKSYEAMTAPDGTIFISQSILSKLDFEDEIASILAHEIMHQEKKTYLQAASTENGVSEISVGFLHEMAADMGEALLLAKAGYNSTAFKSMQGKILGTGRGMIHQSGVARSAEVMGLHYVLDFESSNLPFRTKHRLMEGKVVPTNIEWIEEDYKNRCTSENLKFLADPDLGKLFADRRLREIDRNRPILTELLNRTKALGLDKAVVACFLAADHYSYRTDIRDIIPFKDYISAISDAQPGFFDLVNKYGSLLDKRFKQNYSSYNRLNSTEVRHFLEETFGRYIGGKVEVSQADLYSLMLAGKNMLEVRRTTDSTLEQFGNTWNGEILKLYVDNCCIKNQKLDANKYSQILVYLREKGVSFEFNKQELASRKLSGEDKTKQRELFASAFSEGMKKKESIDVEKYIERIIQAYSADVSDNRYKYADFFYGLKGLLDYLKEINATADQHVAMFNSIFKRITEVDFSESPVLLENPLYEKVSKTACSIFIAQILMGAGNPRAVEIFKSILKTSGIDFKTLRPADFYTIFSVFDIRDSADATRLPFLNTDSTFPFSTTGHCTSRDVNMDFLLDSDGVLAGRYKEKCLSDLESIAELLAKNRELISSSSCVVYDATSGHSDIYGDSLGALLLQGPVRSALLEVVNKASKVTELIALTGIMRDYFPKTPDTKTLLKDLNILILSKLEDDFEAKLDFVGDNIELFGPEGIVALGEMCTTLADYEKMRGVFNKSMDIALKGSDTAGGIALADLATSVFHTDYLQVLRTCDANDAQGKKTLGTLVRYWLMSHGEGGYSYELSTYDPKSGKYVPRAQELCRSFADEIAYLQNLSDFQKSAIVFKMLVESGGILQTKESRKELASIMLSKFSVKDPFASEALRQLVLTADADLIAYPLAQMLGPKLFSSIDLANADIEKLSEEMKKGNMFTRGPAELSKVLSLATEDLFIASDKYGPFPDSNCAKLAMENKVMYQDTLVAIRQLVDRLGAKEGLSAETTAVAENALAHPYEDLIKIGQTLGGPIVRQEQLSAQFYRFAPDIQKLMDSSFDSNPGMKKVVAWENLRRWSTPEPLDVPEVLEEKTRLAEYLNGVEIGDKVGGGSINTVFAAVEKNTGSKIVLRIQNPNGQLFVTETARIVDVVYSALERNPFYRNKALVGRTMNDMARTWCMRDMQDPDYVRNDDRLARMFGRMPEGAVSVPDRTFTHSKVKAEQMASGVTLNQALQQDLGTEREVEILDAYLRLFEHQLDFEKNAEVHPDGIRRTTVHSDAHVGNYMTQPDTPDSPMSVIDRNMCFNLEEEDTAVIKAFLDPEVSRDKFLDAFLERVFVLNKIRGFQKIVVKGNVMAHLAPKFIQQRITGEEDSMALLQNTIETLTLHNITVPLEILLMLRNATAYKNLKARRDALLVEKVSTIV